MPDQYKIVLTYSNGRAVIALNVNNEAVYKFEEEEEEDDFFITYRAFRLKKDHSLVEWMTDLKDILFKQNKGKLICFDYDEEDEELELMLSNMTLFFDYTKSSKFEMATVGEKRVISITAFGKKCSVLECDTTFNLWSFTSKQSLHFFCCSGEGVLGFLINTFVHSDEIEDNIRINFESRAGDKKLEKLKKTIVRGIKNLYARAHIEFKSKECEFTYKKETPLQFYYEDDEELTVYILSYILQTLSKNKKGYMSFVGFDPTHTQRLLDFIYYNAPEILFTEKKITKEKVYVKFEDLYELN